MHFCTGVSLYFDYYFNHLVLPSHERSLPWCLNSASMSLVLAGVTLSKRTNSLSFLFYLHLLPSLSLNLIILCLISPSANETGKCIITWGFSIHLIWYTSVNKLLFSVDVLQVHSRCTWYIDRRFTIFYILNNLLRRLKEQVFEGEFSGSITQL